MTEVSTLADPITQMLSTVGVGGITGLLAYLWVRKDKQYTDLADKVADAFEKNTQVNTELKSAIQNNTKIAEKLEVSITNRVFEVLKEGTK